MYKARGRYNSGNIPCSDLAGIGTIQLTASSLIYPALALICGGKHAAMAVFVLLPHHDRYLQTAGRASGDTSDV